MALTGSTVKTDIHSKSYNHNINRCAARAQRSILFREIMTGTNRVRMGWQRLKNNGNYIQGQNDPLLQFVPANGCPDPVEINVSDELTIIAFDSEWWLFPFSKANPNADCDCTTKDEIVARLEELFYKNRFKVILLASHHPFQSYGVHGG